MKVRFTFKLKILAMLLTIVIVSNTTISFVSYSKSTKNLTNSVNNELKALALDISHQIAAINERELSILHSMAQLDYMRDPGITQLEKQNQLTSVLKGMDSKYENLAFYDAEGNAIVGDGRVMNFKTRAYFSEAFAGKDYISDPTFSTVTNTVLQHYSVPVRDFNNKTIGAIVLVVNGNTLYDTIKDIDIGEGLHPLVVSQKTGIAIANANIEVDPAAEPVKLENLGPIYEKVLQGQSGTEEFFDPLLGVKVISAYQGIENINWSVVLESPYDYYFKDLTSMINSFYIVFAVAILGSIILGIITISILIRPLGMVKNSIEEIASGNADLTKRIVLSSNDEIGDVVKGFNVFVEKLQEIIKNLLESKNNLTLIDSDLQSGTNETLSAIKVIVNNITSVNRNIEAQALSVNETSSAVHEISSNIESLENMIVHQAAGVQQASSAVEEMIENISSVNDAVGKMISSFSTLEQNTTLGIESQKEANLKILEIDEQSKMLQEANSAIANIAEQTNLLAMNAAIEAAHAGEAGKGFSVVADEIRKLSETSATQSKSIGAELSKIQETIKNVVDASTETNNAFNAVTNSIAATSEIISQIKAAMEEQQIGSKQIISSLADMNNSTSEVKIASEEMTAGNKQILTQISNLQNATDMIKQSVKEMKSNAQRIDDTGNALISVSSKVSGSVTEIGDEIGLFKV